MRSQSQIDKIDRRVSFIITFQFIALGIKNTLINAVPYLYNMNNSLNILLLGLVCVLYTYSLFILYHRRTYSGVRILSSLAVISIIFTYVFYPQNIPFWKEYELRFIIILLPSFYLISKLYTLEYFKNYMTRGSYFLTVALVVFAVFVSLIGHTVRDMYTTYSMSMANVAMLSIMWQLRAFLKEKNKVAFVCSIIGSIVLVLYGSRNQLLAITAYIVFHILGNSKYKIVGFSIVSVSVIFIVAFFKNILFFVLTIFERFGLNSRTIYLLIEGGIDESTQVRLDTYSKLNNLLFKNPLVGLGISGDEAKIGELAHSLYYSIWSTYGLFLGSIIILFIIILCIKSLRKSSGLHHQILVLYMCMVFPRSITGGDIWGNAVLWVLLGICFMILNTRKRELLFLKRHH